MISDRTAQPERPAATRPHPSAQRYILRRRHAAASASFRHPQDMRAEVASAFRVLANGVDPSAAQARAKTFYRSSGQAWGRSLEEERRAATRERVGAAFRAMAHGAGSEVAHEAMLGFYCSSGHEWTRALGRGA